MEGEAQGTSGEGEKGRKKGKVRKGGNQFLDFNWFKKLRN
jgi:hypothetical protein